MTSRPAALPTAPDPVAPPSPTGSRAPGWVMATAGGLVLAAVIAVALADGSAEGELSLGSAFILGLVEGITEWLPISSTGHLTVVQELLGIDGDAATSYAIAIQAGAILAVLGLYRHRIRSMLLGVTGRDPDGRRLVVSVAVACLPAAVVGLALEDTIKEHLFGPWPVVAAWLVGGIAILSVARTRLRSGGGAPLAALGWRSAALIGLAQTLALWPGVSRSLVTILAATVLGLSVAAAVEFSFLLGFVILGGATFYELTSSGEELVAAYGVAVPLFGLAVAFVSAALAMRWMVGYLNRHGLQVFGWYRIAVAGVVAVLLLTGTIPRT